MTWKPGEKQQENSVGCAGKGKWDTLHLIVNNSIGTFDDELTHTLPTSHNLGVSYQ